MGLLKRHHPSTKGTRFVVPAGSSAVRARWIGAKANAYYSHDHGHYFPSGPSWTIATLDAARDTPFDLGASLGLSRRELDRVADSIEATERADLERLLAPTPLEWGVTDLEIDGLIEFVLYRRTAVVARLRALVT